MQSKGSALYWMKLGRRVWLGLGNEKYLGECDRDIKRVEEWAASGKAGLPPGIGKPIADTPTNHESAADDQKCKRCGIEKIYWEHFPDCSRFNDQNSLSHERPPMLLFVKQPLSSVVSQAEGVRGLRRCKMDRSLT
jgi:hypothetical protein